MTSDFRPEVEIRPFRAYAMHLAITIGTVRSLIVDMAMWQIPRSTERISSIHDVTHEDILALNLMLSIRQYQSNLNSAMHVVSSTV